MADIVEKSKKMLLEKTCKYCQFYEIYECHYFAMELLVQNLQNQFDEGKTGDSFSYPDHIRETTPDDSCNFFEERKF